MSEPVKSKFYHLLDVDQCPYFEQTTFFSGKWSGVAQVDDLPEQERLNKRGCRQITQEEYETAVKKKREEQDSLGLFRAVIDSSTVGMLLAKPAPSAPNNPQPVRQEHTLENIIKPAKAPTGKRK